MAKFVIQPHGRLQEWIAHEKGYFRDEGLDYEFLPGPSAESEAVKPSGKVTDLMAGAFESYKSGGGNKGVKSDISCACHWTVNQASTRMLKNQQKKRRCHYRRHPLRGFQRKADHGLFLRRPRQPGGWHPYPCADVRPPHHAGANRLRHRRWHDRRF